LWPTFEDRMQKLTEITAAKTATNEAEKKFLMRSSCV
jgi:hypothetical protein